MAEVDQQYYILLHDKSAEKREKHSSGFARKEKKFVSLHKGEILTDILVEDQPKEQTMSTIMIKLKPVDRPLLTLECDIADVRRIDEEEANLLMPLSSLSERLTVFEERDVLRNGKKMDVNSNVWVAVPVNSSNIRQFPGIVRYKGPLSGKPGTMFGVELLLEGKGKGATDGLFKDKHYFRCPKDSGMFVSLEKLKLHNEDIKNIDKDSKRSTEMNGGDVVVAKKGKSRSLTSVINSISTKQTNGNSDDKNIKHEFRVRDIVWVFIGEKPRRGELKYIGRPPGEKDILAGVVLDKKVGEGDGNYCSKQLFNCNKGHAHFCPISNVISKEQFGQMYTDGSNGSSSLKEKFLNLIPKNVGSKDQPPSSNPTSCDDIVHMESKFSKVSETDVIKEQEELLRKAHAEAQKPKEDKTTEDKGRTQEFGVDKGMHLANNDDYEELQMKNYKSRVDVSNASRRNESITSKTLLERSQKMSSMSNNGAKHAISRSLNSGNYSSNSTAGELGYGAGNQNNAMLRDEQKRSFNETTSDHTQNQSGLAGGDSTHGDLEVGSMVEVLSKISAPKYGVIRWIGVPPTIATEVAGLELEEEMEACTDGTFIGTRYFNCPNRRGFFVHLRNCKPDSRFAKGLGNLMVSAHKRLSGIDFGGFKSPIVNDHCVPPPVSLDIYTKTRAVQLYAHRGAPKPDPRGIQGHHNSCYLDATLFATFAFSSIMDCVLLRPKEPKDIDQYERVQNVLRDGIVYPLRLHGFVRADRVLELRQLLDQLGTVSGLVGEEKDPEEFVMTLFQQVLRTEPFLKIKLGNDVREEYFYQVLADRDSERVLPSVEELLKRSFHQSNLKLAEVPSCLIVQMPRFGKGFKMYKRILPSLQINIGELVDNAPQDCTVCGNLATFYCNDCFTITGFQENDCSGNFCKECSTKYHSHARRAKHQYRPFSVSREICSHYAKRAVEHQEMELFAVVCIETSHYVTFAKCADDKGVIRWCFFDSMADRVGAKNGYNIPCVTECEEVVEWLSSKKENRDRIIDTDDKDMPEKVRRILGDAYMCLYQSVEMSMYK